MTFKEIKLPKKLYIVFDDDTEIYQCMLIEIMDVNEGDDKCVLMVKDLVPHQFTRLTVPYSLLDEEEMHLAGVHLYLYKEKAKKSETISF